jgi:hypothetical protein
MYYSIGKNLTAGVANTLFVVPDGHHAKVSMLFIANAGGSTASVSGNWEETNETIPFQGSKSVGAGEQLQFGGEYGYFLILKDGEYLTITPAAGSTFTALVSFELYPHPASNFDLSV